MSKWWWWAGVCLVWWVLSTGWAGRKHGPFGKNYFFLVSCIFSICLLCTGKCYFLKTREHALAIKKPVNSLIMTHINSIFFLSHFISLPCFFTFPLRTATECRIYSGFLFQPFLELRSVSLHFIKSCLMRWLSLPKEQMMKYPMPWSIN